ncbi:MAG: MGMT family protein [Euryarchaeota archaeon]|nr:MGMT family protein [Euryarchaeota archaeon]
MSFVDKIIDLGAVQLKVRTEKGKVKGCRIVEKGKSVSVLNPSPIKDLEPDLSSFSDFERRVLARLRDVPPGRVTTYGRLAEAVGSPGAARAVGRVMAKNPFPIVVPCHRVVRSDGSVGGFSCGPSLKRRLLEAEGVEFDGDRVKREFLV